MDFPEGRRFAFSILDDTDDATFENVSPVYRLLENLGFRTTKTVWPLECPEGSRLYFAADTLERGRYREFVQQLADAGFEVAFHGATMESSLRSRTITGLEVLRDCFGDAVRLHANHGQNRENLYWGHQRFQLPVLRRVLAKFRPGMPSSGAEEASPFFWGDLCQKQFDYVRNFTFRSIDMMKRNPEMPYSLNSTPYVKMWFSTTDAPDVAVFNQRVNRSSLGALERNGGVCIVSTHLGKGFVRDGRVDPQVQQTLRWLATRRGWFVPVSELLDHLHRSGSSDRTLSSRSHARLELSYLLDQSIMRLQSAFRRVVARTPKRG